MESTQHPIINRASDSNESLTNNYEPFDISNPRNLEYEYNQTKKVERRRSRHCSPVNKSYLSSKNKVNFCPFR